MQWRGYSADNTWGGIGEYGKTSVKGGGGTIRWGISGGQQDSSLPREMTTTSTKCQRTDAPREDCGEGVRAARRQGEYEGANAIRSTKIFEGVTTMEMDTRTLRSGVRIWNKYGLENSTGQEIRGKTQGRQEREGEPTGNDPPEDGLEDPSGDDLDDTK